METIKFSFNQTWTGKPVTKLDSDGNVIKNSKGAPQYFNEFGKKIYLGYGWQNAELCFEDFFDLITIGGYATSAYLTNDNRRDVNFISRDVAFVDIDNGMTIQELLLNQYYLDYGTAYYTSPSHGINGDRFRIIFHLERTITVAAEMKALFTGLQTVYNTADATCKDASRIFYGTVNCTIKDINGKFLTNSEIDRLINIGKHTAIPKKVSTTVSSYNKPLTMAQIHDQKSLEDMVDILLEYKKHYPELPYEQRRNVTWACCSHLDKEEVLVLLRELWPDDYNSEGKAINGKYEMFINEFDPTRAYSAGTLINEIRVYNPRFRESLEKQVAYYKEVFDKIQNGIIPANELSKHLRTNLTGKL